MNTCTPLNCPMYPMPKSLSDATVRNAKAKSKPYKISDGDGLFLLVMPTGSKYWRLKYFFGAKEKLLAPSSPLNYSPSRAILGSIGF